MLACCQHCHYGLYWHQQMSPPPSPRSPDAALELHRRLLGGDPVAPPDSAVAYLAYLALRMKEQVRKYALWRPAGRRSHGGLRSTSPAREWDRGDG